MLVTADVCLGQSVNGSWSQFDKSWQAAPTHSTHIPARTMRVREKAEHHPFVGRDAQGIDLGQHRLHLVLEVLVFTDQYLSVYDSLRKSVSS